MNRALLALVLGVSMAADAAAQTRPLVFKPLLGRSAAQTAEPPLTMVTTAAPQATRIINPLSVPVAYNAPQSGVVSVDMQGPVGHPPVTAVEPAPLVTQAEAYSYSGLAGAVDHQQCGRSARPWREAFAWEDGCDTSSVCGPLGRIWFSAEYLYWWTDGEKFPALVTTSEPGTPEAVAGVLGLGSTQILFPTDPLNAHGASGLRLGLGGWINRTQTLGLQVGYIQLAAQEASFYASSDPGGTPILARPFNRFNTGVPDPGAQLVAYPNVFAGDIAVEFRTTLSGIDFAFRSNLANGLRWRIDTLLGYRFLRLHDRLQIDSGQTALDGAAARGILPGTQFVGTESFDTRNDFHGLDAGVLGEYRFGNLSLGGLLKAAYGYNYAISEINGATFTTVNGATATSAGNLLALQSNIGRTSRYKGVIVPELGFNVGWDVTSKVRLKLGYTFIYFDRLFRSSGQIDENINTNLIPPVLGGGPVSPAPVLLQTSTAIHGLNAGLELRY
jgi:hypothetical protein